MNYKVDWEKTVENINFLLMGRTHKKNLSEIFGVEGRTVQRKISVAAKEELSISEFLMLADYLDCDVMDLVILESDLYVEPCPDWNDGWRKVEIEDKSSEEVKKTLDINRKIKESYEIRNLFEFLLYVPLFEEERLRDVVFRCAENLTYDHKHYVMSLLSRLYRSIPECGAKRDADAYRDNILRVKGAPGNNLLGFEDKNFYKYYYKNLERYLEEGNSDLWSSEIIRNPKEKKKAESLGF